MTGAAGGSDVGSRAEQQALALLRVAIGAVALVGMLMVLLGAWALGEPGVGPLEACGLALGLLVLTLVWILRVPRVEKVVLPHAQTLLRLTVSITTLAFGVLMLEGYARHLNRYFVLLTPLHKVQFSEKERVKLYNSRFVERNSYDFGGWPIPLETFRADTPVPRYRFKPSVRMALRNNLLVPADPTDTVVWSSNALGFRGADVSDRKPESVFRIVCLGASTTEGAFNTDDETYPFYLGRELENRSGGRPIEVINAGFSGQTLPDLHAVLRDLVLPLAPDLVLFYGAHNNVNFVEFIGDIGCSIGYPQGTCWLSARSPFFNWWYQQSALFVALSDGLGGLRRVTPPMPHPFDDDRSKVAVRNFADELDRLVGETQQHGVPIVLSSFVTVAHEGLSVTYDEAPGLFFDLNRKWYPLTPGEISRVYDVYNNVTQQTAQEWNLPYLDLAAVFPRELRYFPYDTIHFSAEGNRLLAEFFAEFLVVEGLLEAN